MQCWSDKCSHIFFWMGRFMEKSGKRRLPKTWALTTLLSGYIYIIYCFFVFLFSSLEQLPLLFAAFWSKNLWFASLLHFGAQISHLNDHLFGFWLLALAFGFWLFGFWLWLHLALGFWLSLAFVTFGWLFGFGFTWLLAFGFCCFLFLVSVAFVPHLHFCWMYV